jgi:hypothetical protein
MSYSTAASEIIVYGILNNAPDDTVVTFVWYYGDEEVDRVSFDANGSSGVYVYSTLPNPGEWPTGEYKAEIYIDEREKPDETVEFTVE